MTLALIIVESPNKTKKIEEMFPGQFKVMATVGHICDLPLNPTHPDIGIDRTNIKGNYELTEDKTRYIDGKRVVAKLLNYLKEHPGIEVYLGTDEDREGESIAAFCVQYLKLKNQKRIRFNSITKEKIEAAISNASDIDWHAVASREARRLIDRIFGYSGSVVLRNIIKEKSVAAGRVQTAVEALVIERERKIAQHVSETYYTVHLDLGGWQAEWKVPSIKTQNTSKTNAQFDIDDNSTLCFDKSLVNEIAEQHALIVESCTDIIENHYPPSPFYTISLIQTANQLFNWDAEKTMQVAQKLFEGESSGHGHITYHRTDSPNIDPLAAEEIRSWLRAKQFPVPEKANQWKCKNKQAQEGHEAIRPCYLEVEEVGATDDQRMLYKLIRERALYSQLTPAKYTVKNINLIDAVRGIHQFSANTKLLFEPGWLAIKFTNSFISEENDEKQTNNTILLPNLKKGAMIYVIKSEIQSHTTRVPKRYTINTLTAKLEKLSIGRPATMASILKNVQTKGTIVIKKNNQLEATPLAQKCYDVLYPRFAFSHIGYTAELEEALDQIASGHLDWKNLVRNVWNQFDADCQDLVKT